MLNGHIFTPPNGTRGFDCNTPVSAAIAKQFLAKDFHFVYRYVSRFAKQNSQDLTPKEASGILGAGLGLGVVQHVAPENWRPTGKLGTGYGNAAADRVAAIGLPPGVEIVCDLEGVSPKVQTAFVVEYCTKWHSVVAARGFVPMLYVGWHCGLSSDELYALPFTRYWGAYNVDTVPSIRGFQLKQSEYPGKSAVPGVTFSFDVNTVKTDKLGARPTIFATDGWFERLAA